MPIYSYECSHCRFQFEEIRNINESSGKSYCQKCGNVSFKIPSIFSPIIFKQRSFADGTKTPDFVRTPSQEKAWMKAEGITYDAPIIKKSDLQKERKKRSQTVMEEAFAKANQKVSQGFKLDNPKKRRVAKNAVRFKI